MCTDRRRAWHRVIAAVGALLVPVGILASLPGPALAATGAGGGSVPATTAPRVQYQPPVVGTVVDPYRPPAGPYGPGNRGIDLASPAGSPVVAPADGVVTFAGQVGGQLFVVVRHGDGVRTTMGNLASIAVEAGQSVVAGQHVGTTDGRIHFGARVGTVYIDPNLLLARGWVRLTG